MGALNGGAAGFGCCVETLFTARCLCLPEETQVVPSVWYLGPGEVKDPVADSLSGGFIPRNSMTE